MLPVGGGGAALPVSGAGGGGRSAGGVGTGGGGNISPVRPVGGTASGGPKPVEFNDPQAKANYEDLVAGRGGTVTGGQLNGARLYAHTHGLNMPD